MKFYLQAPALVLLILFGPAVLSAAPATQPELASAVTSHGDEARILFVGGGLIEQEQFRGYIETALTAHFPGRRIICRNLGWSGDTVTAEARVAGYNNPAGLERLLKQAGEVKPTIIFVGYGSVESFNGPAGLPAFIAGYQKLLDALAKVAPDVQFVLLSPTPQEDLGRPTPDPAEHNRSLEQYTAAVEQIAKERSIRFVDLYHPLTKRIHTDNGILPNDLGYWNISDVVERELLSMPAALRIELSTDGKASTGAGIMLAGVQVSPEVVKFRATRDRLPPPVPPDCVAPDDRIRVTGLPAGEWVLAVEGKPVASATAAQWAAGVNVVRGADIEQAESLRQAIVARNELFYRRWRPYNDHPRHYTYLAPDYPLYDKQLEEMDGRITTLARPVEHSYEFTRSPQK